MKILQNHNKMDAEKGIDASSIMKYLTPYWHGDIPQEEVIKIRDAHIGNTLKIFLKTFHIYEHVGKVN